MGPITDPKLIDEVLSRGVSLVFPQREDLRGKLLSAKEPLTIYLGADPTGPSLHLGHLTNLLVLKRLQNLGHKIIFLIGDFTARIGDPTGKLATRKALSEDEVNENKKRFQKQVAKIISFSGDNPATIKYNSEWYKDMKLEYFMGHLLGYFTVLNMLQRNMFDERLELWQNNVQDHLADTITWHDLLNNLLHTADNINLREFIYPILQGYDGWELGKNIGGVDIEVGGNDQTFNMSIGRLLRWAHNGHTKESFFIATSLLIDPQTGKKLMNKSEGGMINLDDSPEDIFGKVMALNDSSMFNLAAFSTEMPMERIVDLQKGVVQSKNINPRDAKLEIAAWAVRTLFDEATATSAREEWERLFSKKEVPDDIPELKTEKSNSLLDLAMQTGVMKSRGEARRLIEQGGVEIDGVTKKDPQEKLDIKGGETLRVGKKHFFRIKI